MLRRAPGKRIDSRIYFFPALLPLAAVLPWLLTAFGAIAGLLLKLLRPRNRRALAVASGIATLGLVAAFAYHWPRLRIRAGNEGSRLSPASELPRLQLLGPIPPVPALAVRPYEAGKSRLLWSTPLPRRALSTPLLAGGLLIVGTWENSVDAYALDSGLPVWSVPKKEPVYALASDGESLLFAGEGLHVANVSSLTAVELPGGRPVWQREFAGHLESPAAYSAAAKRVLFSAGPDGLWCLDARNGAVVWHAKPGHVDSTPLLLDGKVFFSAQPREGEKASVFLALDEDSGMELWRIPLEGMPWGSPVLDPGSGLVVTSTGTGQIGAPDPADKGWAYGISLGERKIAWRAELPGNPIEASVLVPGPSLAVFTATNGEISALRARDGGRAWRHSMGGPVQAEAALGLFLQPPLLTGTDLNGSVHLLDAATGRLREKIELKAGGYPAPLFLPDGFVYASYERISRYAW